MEKNQKLINEISKVRNLMGVKTIINEQVPWVLLIKNLIKVGASNVDMVFDDVADMLIASGKVTREQADEAIALLKQNADLVDNIRTKYTKTNFDNNVVMLADDLAIANKIDDILKSSGSESAEKFAAGMKTIPESQIQQITKGVISKLFKEGALPNAISGYERILNFWKEELRANLDNGDVVLNLADFKSSQKMWAYKYCNRALLVEGTNFTDDMAEEFINLFDNRLMNDTEIKELLEQYRLAGKIDEAAGVINPPKLGQTLDEPIQYKPNGSKKNPFKVLPANIRNFGKNISSTLETSYGKLYTFYINVFRPNFRAWLIAPESAYYKLQNLGKIGVGKAFTDEFAVYTAKFEEAFNVGFSKFVSGEGSVSKQYINEIKDKLLKLKNAKTPKNPLDNFDMQIKDLWDSYVRTAKSALHGYELEQFNQFVKLIEGQESTYFYSSLDELFETGAKDAGIKSPRSYVDDAVKAEKEIATKADDLTKNTINWLIATIKKRSENITSMFLSGTFRTPRDVEKYLAKKGYSVTSGTKLLLKPGIPFYKEGCGILWMSFVVLPTIVGLMEATWDGAQKTKGLKGQKVSSDNFVINLFESYVLPRIVDHLMGKAVVGYFFTGKNTDWWEAFAVLSPGYVDNTLLDLINLWRFTTKKDGESAQQLLDRTATEKSVEKIDKGLKEDYDKAVEKDKVLKSKGLVPIYVDKIANNDFNKVNITKTRIDDLVSSGDITQKDADFLKTRLKYVPKVPLDFLFLVKQKQRELISKGAEKLGELQELDGAFGNVENIDVNKIPKSSVGSLVLVSKSGVEYLVLNALTKYPTTTTDVLDTITSLGEVAWVTPKFTELNSSTAREYNNISTFIKQYNYL
jgi:hypothetical protein